MSMTPLGHDDGESFNHREILLANSKTKLVLSQSSQYSKCENRIRQQYP